MVLLAQIRSSGSNVYVPSNQVTIFDHLQLFFVRLQSASSLCSPKLLHDLQYTFQSILAGCKERCIVCSKLVILLTSLTTSFPINLASLPITPTLHLNRNCARAILIHAPFCLEPISAFCQDHLFLVDIYLDSCTSSSQSPSNTLKQLQLSISLMIQLLCISTTKTVI